MQNALCDLPRLRREVVTTSTEGRSGYTANIYRVVAKTLRVMQLTAFLLLVACLQVSARVVSQTVTITGSEMRLENVFTEVERQTGFVVVYNYELLRQAKPVTINATDEPIQNFIERVLVNQPLTYSILNTTISIRAKIPTANLTPRLPLKVELPPVSGVIRDADGNPLGGVNIIIKGTKKGVTTDANGKFSIEANANDVLIISSIGFNIREVRINSTNTALTVALEKSISPLDEVQIIAYGKTTQRLSTGNISTVKADVIEKQPVNNPLMALQGRVPGLFIEQATGLPGSGIKVRIQGVNSMLAGNDPFYVIDGVPFISQLLPTNNTITGSSGVQGISGNPFSFINPADIESIDVLKDADATAIYGSRAANGAILITTKKGKAGPTKIDIVLQSGWAKASQKMKLLNTQEFLAMRHEAISNLNATIKSSDYDLNGTWDTARNTDWQKELIGNTARYTDVQLNISGGSSYHQFLFGAGYHKETTVYPGSFDDKKGSVHFNLNSHTENRKLNVQVTGSFLFDDNHLPTKDITAKAIGLTPVAPAPFNADGTLNWMPNAAGASTYSQNPFASLAENSNTKTLNLVGNALISYEVIRGLFLKGSVGYNNLFANEITKYPTSIYIPEYAQYYTNATSFLTNRTSSWTIEPQITYNRKIYKGKFDLLIGSTLTQLNNDQQNLSASGFSNELVMENLASATNITGTNINSTYKYNALYGRMTYNMLNKYIINLSARRDGSSRFGSKNQFHNFGAIGAVWIFSEEPFIKTNFPLLSFGKLRGSYGTTGNDQIGDFQFIDIYEPLLFSGNPYQGIIGLASVRLTNPYLQWEETKKFQMGLELGFIRDKIIFTVNYNQNRSANQLTFGNLSSITGFTGIIRNFPAVIQNTGWEFTLTSTNIKRTRFSWVTNINLTIPKNQLLSYFGQDKNNSIAIGKPLSFRSLYNYAGVNDTTGIYQFRDAKGSITTTPSDPIDRTVIVDFDPKFYGGIQNTFNYKNFSLTFFFQFTKKPGTDRVSYGLNNVYPGYFNAGMSNQSTSVLDRWQKAGDKASIQQYRSGGDRDLTSINNSNATYIDASYIKLRNISLSWQLPGKWEKNLHFQSSRIFVNAQNLITITAFKGLDPETDLSLPPLRIVTVGVQITL